MKDTNDDRGFDAFIGVACCLDAPSAAMYCPHGAHLLGACCSLAAATALLGAGLLYLKPMH